MIQFPLPPARAARVLARTLTRLRMGADWEESQHPRDESGKFTDGGGEATGGGEGTGGGAPSLRLVAEREKAVANVEALVDRAVSHADFGAVNVDPEEAWQDLDSDAKIQAYHNFQEEMLGSDKAAQLIDWEDIDKYMFADLIKHNEPVVKDAKNDTVIELEKAFPYDNPSLPGMDQRYREIDENTFVGKDAYDETKIEDDGDGNAPLDLDALRFTNGDELTEAEKEKVGNTWDTNYKSRMDEAKQEIKESDSYSETVSEEETKAIDHAWDQMATSEKVGYLDENDKLAFELTEGPQSGAVSPGPPENWVIDTDVYEKSGQPRDPNLAEDYNRTRILARSLATERTLDLLKERGLSADRNNVERMASKTWEQWKGSSTRPLGLAIQLAAAEEFGGVHRLSADEEKRARQAVRDEFGVGNRYPPFTSVKPEDQQAIKDYWVNEQFLVGGSKADAEAKWDALPPHLKDNASDQYINATQADLTYGGRDKEAMDRFKAYLRGQWDTTQYLMHKAGKDDAEIYRAIILPKKDLDATTNNKDDVWTKLPDIALKRNGASSTSSNLRVVNNWQGVGVKLQGDTERVVLRFKVPSTSLLSIPVFGQNLHNESEYVLIGRKDPWAWDAYRSTAPSFNQRPVKSAHTTSMLRAAAKGKVLVIDMKKHDQGPHWLSGYRKEMRSAEAEWDETQHPRDESGKFSDKEGGGGAEDSAGGKFIAERQKAVDAVGDLLDQAISHAEFTATRSEEAQDVSATWDDLSSKAQEAAKRSYVNKQWDEGGPDVDDSEIRARFEKEVRENNEDIITTTEDNTLKYLDDKFPHGDPTLPGLPAPHRLIDPESMVYGDDTGEGSQLDLDQLRFKDGNELTPYEKDLVNKAWNVNYDNAFLKEFEKATESHEYYEERDQLVSDAIDQEWDALDDDEKFDYAPESDKLDAHEAAMENNPQAYQEKMDPSEPYTWVVDTEVEENTGAATNPDVREDYDKTRILSRQLAVERGAQLLKERGLSLGSEAADRRFVEKMAGETWGAWKSSSTTPLGYGLQLAAAEELGGVHRLTPEQEQKGRDAIAATFGYQKSWSGEVPQADKDAIKEHWLKSFIPTLAQTDPALVHPEEGHKPWTPEQLKVEADKVWNAMPSYMIGSAARAYEKDTGRDVLSGRPEAMDRFKAYLRSQWETTQYVMHKAEQDDVNIYRAIVLPKTDLDATTNTQSNHGVELPDLRLKRNGASSTTSNIEVANDWQGVGVKPDKNNERVVLRFRVPSTSLISIPVFGQNLHNESEYVLLGRKDPWKWDAWRTKAPTFQQKPIKIEHDSMLKAAARKKPLVIDMAVHDEGPHWMTPWREQHSKPRYAARKNSETEVHAAADAHEAAIKAVVMQAIKTAHSAVNLPMLREALKNKDRKAARKALAAVPGAMRATLQKTLPDVLRRAHTAGGRAGMVILKNKLRTSGGPGSGNFGHAGRPGEVGGSASADSAAADKPKDKKGTIHNVIVEHFDPDMEKAILGGEGRLRAITEKFVETVPGDFTVILSTERDKETRYPMLKAVALGDNGAQIVNTYTNIDGELEVHHDLLKLPSALQGEGIGKDLLRTELEEYQKLGVERVKLLANIDVGGYAWAKYGYTLDPEGWEHDTRQFKRLMEDRLEEIGADKFTKDLINETINLRTNPDDGELDGKVIWDIADLKRGEHKLGAEILLGMDWNAQFDMHDPDAMRRAKKYIG